MAQRPRKSKNNGENSGALIPQPHGGALRRAGTKGNKGGGRPRDAIKQAYVELLSEHGVALLRNILTGKVTVPLERKCEHCGKKPTRPRPDPAELLELVPDLNTRLRALGEANRYGLGGREELTLVHPEVTTRVQATLRLIASRPSWDSEELINELGASVWLR